MEITYKELDELQSAIFKKVLPKYGYHVRENQIELAGHMLNALHKRAITLAESEVGTGKTHAYLIASALIKQSRINDLWTRGKYPLGGGFYVDTPMPIVISTSSIALQNAIINDYIPEISRIFMKIGLTKKPLTGVIRKGKEHYICDMRLKAFAAFDADPKALKQLEPLLEKGCSHIDLGEMDYLKPFIKRKINVMGNCGSNCPSYRDCRYARFLKHAQSSEHDFQVCNHNYWLADTVRRSKGQHPLIPNYQAVIIDEAHKFLQAARQIYGTEISASELPQIAEYIKSFVFKQRRTSAGIKAFVETLTAKNKELFSLLEQNVLWGDESRDESERAKTTITRAAAKQIRDICLLIDRILWVLEESTVIKKYEKLYSYATWAIGDIRERISKFKKHRDMVYWLEIDRRMKGGEITLCSIPKNLDESLYRDLWSGGLPVIFTSGTLAVNGNFDYIKQKIGLNRVSGHRLMETSKPSPFNYKDNVLLYISQNMPFPNHRDNKYIEAAASEIARLIQATHGHTAVLFTSYKMMELVFNILDKRGTGYPLIKLDRNGIKAIERFENSGNGVLFASGSLWEGIDLPGDILSSLIIVKLPFAVPDPISEYEQALYSSFDEYKNKVVVPEMLIKLKQGFGRLIRRESDSGVVAILDSRTQIGGAYRKQVIHALPDCGVTSRIDDVEQFILHVKNEDYFIGACYESFHGLK